MEEIKEYYCEVYKGFQPFTQLQASQCTSAHVIFQTN
jgi:hypothetical protein